MIGFPQKALTRVPYRFTVSTIDNNDTGMESSPKTVPSIAIPANIDALGAPPEIEENSSEKFGILPNTPKPVVTINTKKTASIQVLRCALNACLAYSFISCLGLIVMNPFLSFHILPGQYIKVYCGCQ